MKLSAHGFIAYLKKQLEKSDTDETTLPGRTSFVRGKYKYL